MKTLTLTALAAMGAIALPAAAQAQTTAQGPEVYVRGGFQEVDFNLRRFVPFAPANADDTDGDYLVGAGVEFGLGESAVRFRAGIDTIAFDSTRATVGVLFGF